MAPKEEPMAHTNWTEVEARAVIEAWKASGLSAYKFSIERGIRNQRLYYWAHKLGELGQEDEIRVLPVQLAESSPSQGEPVLVMLRSGHMLKVGRNFDEVAFRRTIEALEQC